MKIAIVANTSWYVFNFRRNLMSALRAAGHEPVSLAGADTYVDKLDAAGFRQRAIPFTGAGLNPWRELKTIVALRRVLRAEGVKIALTYTPKATIYTALALAGARTRVIANISGLGRAFVRNDWLTVLVQALYWLALKRADVVFFQNADDRNLFLRRNLVGKARASLIPGSGVDLKHFSPRESAMSVNSSPSIHYLMVARLIWDKGVAEFVEAACCARARDPRLRFTLLGPRDPSPSSGVPDGMLRDWVAAGVVDYVGSTDDVRPYLAAADCVVLPSYREGVPRSLLEAASMARPIITTDATGCRDCVQHGFNGYLCRPRDAVDLERQILAFAALTTEQRLVMGHNSRLKAALEFDEQIVIKRYLQAVEQLAKTADS